MKVAIDREDLLSYGRSDGQAGTLSSVSLVATVLNEVAALPELLGSIDSQTRAPDETIIVDGGSTDGTSEALQAWAAAQGGRVVVRLPGANIAQGRNAAIERASGQIIAVTDAGVALRPDWLDQLVSALEADPSRDVACGFFLPETHGSFECALAATVLPATTDVDPARFLPSSRSVAFRRTAWADVGGYPEWLDYCEDLLFDLALKRAGRHFVWVPKAVVEFRPRASLTAFFRQYYLYARGDGKANLWPWRHAIRYGAYLVGLPLLWRGRHRRVAVAAGVLAACLYVRRPAARLLDAEPTAGAARASTWRSLALIPVIRVVGDVAKMVGYPVGVVWRLGNAPPARGLGIRGQGAARGEGSLASHRTQDGAGPWLLPRPTCDLSVIVVSYNTRDRLRACLRSIEASHGIDDVEMVVVDNASRDGSADMVAAEFPKARLIRSPVNGGFAYANNRALRRSSGRYLLLLNPDTELSPRALADMLVYIQGHPEAAAAGPKLVRADGSLDLACRRSFPTPGVAFSRLTGMARLFPRSRRFGRYNVSYLDPAQDTDVDAVSGAFMLVRREAVESVGLLDERFFMYGEDLDWAYRMKDKGWRIRYNPRVAVLHHKGESSRQTSQRSTVAFYRAMRLFYEKHYQASTPRVVDGLIRLAIHGRLAWSLLKNALRPREQRRVST